MTDEPAHEIAKTEEPKEAPVEVVPAEEPVLEAAEEKVFLKTSVTYFQTYYTAPYSSKMPQLTTDASRNDLPFIPRRFCKVHTYEEYMDCRRQRNLSCMRVRRLPLPRMSSSTIHWRPTCTRSQSIPPMRQRLQLRLPPRCAITR